MSVPQGQDFIASELLSELKADGLRKAAQIERLQNMLVCMACVSCVALLVAVTCIMLAAH